jgi:hypothetical protein
MHISFFFIHLEGPHYVLASMQLTTGCGQDRALKHLENVRVLSDVCVDSSFTFVSVLFLFCFVSDMFLSLFLSV